MALTAEQVAQLAYQAGFRGEALAEIVAIGKRESGYNPEAHRTDGNPGGNTGDFGLFQINYVNVPGLVKAGIIGSARDLLDPLKNARAAFTLSHSGTSFGAWNAQAGVGWSASGSPLAGTNITAARAAVQNAANQGLLGQDYQSGGAVSDGAGGAVFNGQIQDSTSTAINLPSDAKVYRDASGTVGVVFDVGGATIYYDVPPAQWASVAQQYHAQQISDQQWADFVSSSAFGGDAHELNQVASTSGSYRNFWDSILNQVMGPNNPARNDPEVRKVLAEFAGRPDMTPAELQNKLQATQWWQTHTQGQIDWNGLSPAEQKSRSDDMASKMVQTWFQYTGEMLDVNDARIQNYVQDLASGKTGIGSWTEAVVKKAAADNPNSPFERQIADEQKAQKQGGIDIENTALKIRQTLTTWGLNWSESTIQDWARRIVNKDSSDDDLTNAVKDQAKVLYPWKDRETDTTSAAAPWTETFKRVMEKDAPLTDPTIQKALTSGQQPWAFEQDLKKSSGWLETKNARDSLTGMAGNIGKLMGFA